MTCLLTNSCYYSGHCCIASFLSLQQVVELRSWQSFNWWLAAAEDPRATASLQNCGFACNSNHRAFTQPDHRSFVFLEILQQSFFTSLTHMTRIRISVEIMWIDLKAN